MVKVLNKKKKQYWTVLPEENLEPRKSTGTLTSSFFDLNHFQDEINAMAIIRN